MEVRGVAAVWFLTTSAWTPYGSFWAQSNIWGTAPKARGKAEWNPVRKHTAPYPHRRSLLARDTVTTSVVPLLRFAWSSTRIRSLSMTRAGADTLPAFVSPYCDSCLIRREEWPMKNKIAEGQGKNVYTVRGLRLTVRAENAQSFKNKIVFVENTSRKPSLISWSINLSVNVPT